MRTIMYTECNVDFDDADFGVVEDVTVALRMVLMMVKCYC